MEKSRKIQLNSFATEIRGLLNAGEIATAQLKIEQANLSKEEFEFFYNCLTLNGYDSKTDKISIKHSDNSAFLDLVNLVLSKTKE